MAPNAEVELELTFLDVAFAAVVADAETAALDKKYIADVIIKKSNENPWNIVL